MEYKDFLELAEGSLQNRIYVGKGSFSDYKERVEEFKKDRPDIIDKYRLTEPELFVMFMMVIKNYGDIQEQFFPLSRKTLFSRACMQNYDSFLKKIPVSTSFRHYRLERYYNIGDFEKMWKTGQHFICNHYLTASSSNSIFQKLGDGVKLYLNKPKIGKVSNVRAVFEIYNETKENQVNYLRNSRFQIDYVDKQKKEVILTEL